MAMKVGELDSLPTERDILGSDAPGQILTFSIICPDDWHLHLRDRLHMAHVVCDSARRFRRALIMSNLRPPITTTAMAVAYRERILAALPSDTRFDPQMTLYLTDHTHRDEVSRAREEGVRSIKLYPAGATTNSDDGVTDIRKCHRVLAAMEREGMPLCIHGEVTDPDVDIYDRERVFIDRVLIPLRRDFPELRIVFEHITTEEAAEYVMAADHRYTAASITGHHLRFNRSALFAGGIRPHHYCLPVLKREKHRQALVKAAMSGSPQFFYGSDSAPHAMGQKEAACGCAGCYTALGGLEDLVALFESAGELDRLEYFVSGAGADFYRLPRNTDRITFIRKPWEVPTAVPFGLNVVQPLWAGATLAWQIAK